MARRIKCARGRPVGPGKAQQRYSAGRFVKRGSRTYLECRDKQSGKKVYREI